MFFFGWKMGRRTNHVDADLAFLYALGIIVGPETVLDCTFNAAFAAARAHHRYRDTCLPDALTCLGFNVEIYKDGPHSIEDADACLKDVGCETQRVDNIGQGKFLFRYIGHFIALNVGSDCIVIYNRHWFQHSTENFLLRLTSIPDVSLHEIVEIEAERAENDDTASELAESW